MDAHLSAVNMFQRDSGHYVFLCTFPIMVAQISLTTISLPICLVWSLTMSRDVVVILQLQRARRKHHGKAGREGDMKIHLASLWKQLSLGTDYFSLVVQLFLRGKKQNQECVVSRTKAGQQDSPNHNVHTAASPNTHVSQSYPSFQVAMPP